MVLFALDLWDPSMEDAASNQQPEITGRQAGFKRQELRQMPSGDADID